MADEPVEALGEMLGNAAKRIGDHAAIWQEAAERNAAGRYTADDVLVDLQRSWKLALNDLAQGGAALMQVLGSLTPQQRGAEDEPAPARRKAPAKKATVAKKASGGRKSGK